MSDHSSEVHYASLDFLGFPKYRVGSDGTVWSFRCHGWPRVWRWKQLRPAPSRGYMCVVLANNVNERKTQSFKVHSLVLLAFVGPRPDGMEARHFPDRNRANNNLDNLSWGTQQQNQKDKVIHGTACSGIKGSKHGCSVLNETQVLEIRKLASIVKNRDLAVRFGVKPCTIKDIKSRRTWTHI